MRTRTRDDRETITPISYWTGGNTLCQDISGTNTHDPITTGSYESITDVVIPNFRARSARGEVFINPLTTVKTTESWSAGAWSYFRPKEPGQQCAYGKSFSESWWGRQHMPGSSSIPIDYANLQRLAGTQAAATVRPSETQGLVTVAELRRTLGFLRRPLQSWDKLITQAKRDKNRHRSQLERNKTTGQFLSDSWLAYRYGARPIVFDVQNIARAIAALQTKELRPERETARGHSQYSTGVSTSSQTTEGVIVYETKSRTDVEVNVRSGVLYETHRGIDPLGIDLFQIPSAAYELVPFSFVADMFVNLGTLIEAISPKHGVARLGQWTTTRTTTRTTATVDIVDLEGPTYELTSHSPITREKLEQVTTRVPSLSIGAAYQPLPLSGDIGQKKHLDLIALSRRKLRSR